MQHELAAHAVVKDEDPCQLGGLTHINTLRQITGGKLEEPV
jgi:hypothetical protein